MNIEPLPPNSLVIVCGMRKCSTDQVMKIWSALDTLKPWMVIQGGAHGVDSAANNWCLRKGVACSEVSANWGKYGSRAGPKRNQWMLDLKPNYVIAFPGGKGTASMVSLAHDAGVEVIHPYPSTS